MRGDGRGESLLWQVKAGLIYCSIIYQPLVHFHVEIEMKVHVGSFKGPPTGPSWPGGVWQLVVRSEKSIFQCGLVWAPLLIK